MEARTKRHDHLRNGDPCPHTGKPFDGYSWSRHGYVYSLCRQCADADDPKRAGLAASLRDLDKRRTPKSELRFRHGPEAMRQKSEQWPA